MLEKEEIKKHYEKLDDSRIKLIALHDARGLRDDTVSILFHEIEKRQLDPQLIDWVQAVRRKLSNQEWRDLKTKVQSLPCNECGRANRKLKGYEFTTKVGLLFEHIDTHYKFIICPDCGRKKRRKSAIRTSILGWWSLNGLLSTPFELIRKWKSFPREDQESVRIIEAFIEQHIGEITLGGDRQEVIGPLLVDFNLKGQSIDH